MLMDWAQRLANVATGLRGSVLTGDTRFNLGCGAVCSSDKLCWSRLKSSTAPDLPLYTGAQYIRRGSNCQYDPVPIWGERESTLPRQPEGAGRSDGGLSSAPTILIPSRVLGVWLVRGKATIWKGKIALPPVDIEVVERR